MLTHVGRGVAARAQIFRNPLHIHTQYDTQQPNFAWCSNEIRGKFLRRQPRCWPWPKIIVPWILTCGHFVVANILVTNGKYKFTVHSVIYWPVSYLIFKSLFWLYSFQSFGVHTEAKSLNDLVIAGDLKTITAHLNSCGMLVTCVFFNGVNSTCHYFQNKVCWGY